MAYLEYSKVKTSLFEHISTKKRWKEEFEDGYVITEDMKRLTEECMLKTDRILDEWYITRLARLIRWASDEEVRENWNIQVEYYNGKKRPKGSPSLDNFILNYGKKKGTELFLVHTDRVRKTNKEKGVFSKKRYMNRGYSEKEAEEIISNASRKASTKRWSRIPKNQRSLNTKRNNPLSKLCKLYDGMSDDEREKIRYRFIEPCIHSKERYVKDYGKEGGEKRFEELTQKRKSTRFAKGAAGFQEVKKGSASKQSLNLFDPLIEWLNKKGYSNEDIYIGKRGHRGERWIRDKDMNYYLYDFTVMSLSLIIEYHGVRWHPLDDGTWHSEGLKNKNPEELRKRDINKKRLAEENGYVVLEIWSNECIISAIEKCKRFIDEREQQIQSLQNRRGTSSVL